MAILVRGIKPKLVTRLLPTCYYFSSSSSSSSSSSRVLPPISVLKSLLAPSPSSAPELSLTFEQLLDKKASSTTLRAPSPSFSSSSIRIDPKTLVLKEDSKLWEGIKSVTDPESSVLPVLDQWILEENTVEKSVLRSIISLLQREKRYKHALEISNWVANKDWPQLDSDAAIRASLFRESCGFEHVEAYFNDVFQHRITHYDYLTLLCYYVEENYVEKAETIMQTMRQKGFIKEKKSIFPYKLLMKLYSRKGDIEKMNILLQEMETDKVKPDKAIMEACIAASHIPGIGKILDQIGLRESKPLSVSHKEWPIYVRAVNAYLKFGLIEPALTVLRKMERRKLCYPEDLVFNLKLYVKTGRKDELYRVWNTYKELVYLDDEVFSFMISSLLKLGDVEGAGRIAEEWHSNCTEHSGLWKRIKNVEDRNDSVVPVLDQWICEGNSVEGPLLWSLIGLLQGYKRYNHANEISDWMRDCQYAFFCVDHAAVRLRIIHRTLGLEHAETYFKDLSERQKNFFLYCALLCCYVEKNSVKKAEAIMEEMREKRKAMSPYPYNLLVRLYSRNGEFDKIDILMQEMEINRISPDKYTISYLMTAYVAASNISGMEKILDQINKDPQLVDGCGTYIIAANGFLKFGLIEPALTVLRKMETMMLRERSLNDFECLVSLYAKTGRKDDLFRVWNTYNSSVELNDKTFLCMLSSLLKLEDIVGAERIFGEWESQCTSYNSQLLNKLLISYCEKGLLKKAEATFAKALKRRRTVSASTFTILAGGYFDQNRMTKGIEMFKRAVFISSKEWNPYPVVLNACLDYLEVQGDTQTMEEMIKSFRSKELMTRDMYHRLVRTYVATGKGVECLDRSLMVDFPADEEINKILEGNKSSA